MPSLPSLHLLDREDDGGYKAASNKAVPLQNVWAMWGGRTSEQCSRSIFAPHPPWRPVSHPRSVPLPLIGHATWPERTQLFIINILRSTHPKNMRPMWHRVFSTPENFPPGKYLSWVNYGCDHEVQRRIPSFPQPCPPEPKMECRKRGRWVLLMLYGSCCDAAIPESIRK